MQKDMKLIVKNFFDSVYSYTEKMSALYVDEMAKAQLAKAIASLHTMQQQIERIQSSTDSQERYRLASELYVADNIGAEVFTKPGSQNNFVYWAFVGVIREISNLYKTYSPFYQNTAALDKELARWYYHISDSLFKDFVYALYPGHYAKKAMEKQK